jgi:Ca2+-dependent lipid-binding protein
MALAWCRALKAMDRNGFSDPYLTLQVEGHKQRRQTKTINKTLNPTWNELYVVTPVTSSQMLQIHVWDKDMIGKDDLIGCATVPLAALARLPDAAGSLEHSAPEEGDAEWLTIRDLNGDETGQVGLAMALKALPANGLQPASSDLPAGVGPDVELPLMITAVAGRNLKAMDRGGTSDPYLTFEVSSAIGKTTKKCKSKVIKKTCNPQWGEDMTLPVSGLEIGQELLVVKCFDKDMLGSDDLIGGFQVPLADIFSQPTAGAVWHALREESAAGIEVTGEVLLELTIEKPDEEEEMKEEGESGEAGAAGQVASSLPVVGMGEYEDELLLSTEELLQRRRRDREQRGLLARGSRIPMQVSAQADLTGDVGESEHVEGVAGELVKEGMTVMEGQ